MTTARKLTDTYIKKKIKAPSEGQADYPDTDARGLALRVTSNDIRSWVFVYRFAGKQARLTYGRADAVTLEQARDMAHADRKLIGQKIDPREARRQKERDDAQAAAEARRKDAETFGALADKFIEEYAKQEQKTWAKTKYYLDKYVMPVWQKLPSRDITRRDCIDLIANLKTSSGPYSANNVRSMLNKLFGWACEEDLLDVNPCRDVRRPVKLKDARRDHVLTDSDIAKIWRAADSMPYPFGPYIKLLFLTAQRRSEVGTMSRPQLDMSARVWRIPRESTKAKRLQTVPLSKQAVDLINSLPRFVPGEFVFSRSAGKQPMNGYGKNKKRLDDLSGVKGWRLHDIRRTAATRIADDLSVPVDIVGKILNHAPQGVTAQVYVQSSHTKAKAGPLQAWADHIDRLLADNPAEAANK